MKTLHCCSLALSVLAGSVIAPAQSGAGGVAASTYDPRVTFAPLVLPDPVNAYRSGSGAPGPQYWQNEADYVMRAGLDAEKKVLTNDEVITYTNNSPDTLTSLWIHLEQNEYRKDSRQHTLGTAPGGFGGRGGGGAPAGSAAVGNNAAGAAGGARRGRGASAGAGTGANAASGGAPRSRTENYTEGFELDSVTMQAGAVGATSAVKAEYIVSDTRMQVPLTTPLKPHTTMRIHIKYHYTIPGTWGGRTSWGATESGAEIYDIAQWYPRMCVYDDLRGWDTLPYIGSEFYLEYGHFDYYVTVPAGFIVAGTGELVNPKEVLTPTQISRIEQARGSDKTVYIRTLTEAQQAPVHPPASDTKTWHYHMGHTRDVVWSASPAFIWDAARINLPSGKKALAESVYPPESVGPDHWDRSTEITKFAIEYFSKRWYEFPWPVAFSIGGFSSGMEYPGAVFDGVNSKMPGFFGLTVHEFGHSWFPMLVGSNERRNAFMDEGFNTFIDIAVSDVFENGKFGPKRDGEYSAGGEPPDTILKVLDNPEAPVPLSRADAYSGALTHPVSYFKGAYGNTLLRDQILGPERFDEAFRKYTREWAFKHPSPSDFFRTMESEGGEDLSYFWRGWYMNNWTLDLAVEGASYVGGDAKNGLTVTVVNKRPLVLPATLEVTYSDGSKERMRIPAEAWLSKGTANFTFQTGKTAVAATVDPDHVLPDDDRANNTFRMP
ncbi:MAG TPA: M1 family metallopeptidase [Acidobacteriaceae bacterium]